MQDIPDSGILWAEAIAMAPRPQRRSKSVDALKKNSDSPHITAAVALLFQNDRKVDKARSWFQRSITLQPSFGDGWALWYRFETQLGTPDHAAAVMKQCVAVEPRYGERWQRVAKDPKNMHLPVEQLLRLVVVDTEKEPPP